MKALVISGLSDDLSGCAIADIPMPQRGSGQILVRIGAAALNFPDLLMTRGAYQLKPPLPFVPGMDAAGVVLEADPDCRFRPGDRVACAMRLGAFAEQAVVDAAMVRAIPDGMDDASAAAFGAAYLTAYVGLVRAGQLIPGQWVLVHGASGGVGLAAVDFAKALGAKVIAASGSAEKLATIERLYQPDATLLAEGRFRDRVMALTGDGADLVYDPVGGDIFDESTRCVRFGGKLLVIGFASGRIATVDTNIPLIKGFSVVGVRAGEFGRRFPELGRANLEAIWTMAAQGMLRPHVHGEYPLADWRQAFDAMAARQLVGKVILRP